MNRARPREAGAGSLGPSVEADAPLAPPVVAVVVVHDPGPWFDEALDGTRRPGLPQPQHAVPARRRPRDAEVADLRDPIPARLPDAFVRAARRQPRLRRRRQRGAPPRRGRQRVLLLLPRRRRARARRRPRRSSRSCTARTPAIVGPKLVEWDDPRRAPARRARPRPLRRDRPDHRARRGTTRSSTTPSATCSSLPSACLLVRADLFRALGGFDAGDHVPRRRRRPVLAGPPRAAPGSSSSRRPGPATVEQLEARRPDLNHAVLRARHRMRSRGHADRRRAAAWCARSSWSLLTVVELVVGLFTGRFGEALGVAAGARRARPAHAGAPRPARRDRQAPAASPNSEVLGLQTAGSARLTSYLRGRETTTYVGADTTVRRWRESSLGTTPSPGSSSPSRSSSASRTLIDTRVPPVGEFLPLPESARELVARLHARGGTRAGSAAPTPTPTGWAVLVDRQRAGLFQMGLGLTVLVVGLIARRACSACGGWRRCSRPTARGSPPSSSTPRRRSLPGVMLDRAADGARRLRRPAVVRPPAARRRRHRHRRPGAGRRRARRRHRRAAAARAGPAHRRARRSSPPSPRRSRRRCSPSSSWSTVVLALAVAGRRRRRAHRRLVRRPRPGGRRRRVGAQPAVVGDVVVGRPGRRRRSPGPTGRGAGRGRARWTSVGRRLRRARASPSTCPCSSPSPSPGRGASRGRPVPPGWSSCSACWPCCRTATRCRSALPDVGVLLVPVAARRWRSPPRRRRRVRRRRRRAPLRLAPAGRPARRSGAIVVGMHPRRRSRSPTARWYAAAPTLTELVDAPAARRRPTSATTGCCSSATRG